MKIYGDVIYELAFNEEIQNNINSLDDELKGIFEKLENMFIDMSYRYWEDDSEIYGGITFGEFKRIYMILLSQVKSDPNVNHLQTPLPCKDGDEVWQIYADGCGNAPCEFSCLKCKDVLWKKVQVQFNKDLISEYNKSIFLTEEDADKWCSINKQLAEIRYRYKNPMKKGDEN